MKTQNKKVTKKHGVRFVGQLPMSMRPSQECGWYARSHVIEENWLPLSLLLGDGFLARVGTCWEFEWLEPVQVLWVHVGICLVVSGRRHFLGVTHHVWILQSFYFLFCSHPWALRGRMKQTFRAEHSQVSVSAQCPGKVSGTHYLLQEASLMRVRRATDPLSDV